MASSPPSLERLKILCWDGYDDPSLLNEFSRRNNCLVNAQGLVSDSLSVRQIQLERNVVDILNINNPFAKKVLYPEGLIRRLDGELADQVKLLSYPIATETLNWAFSDDGFLLGIPQRFGPFNMVVNTRRLSRNTAESEGFNIIRDTEKQLNYGILLFPEFNVFHICIAASINPFEKISSMQLDLFESTANEWFSNATLVSSDSRRLNDSLLSGEIDLILSAGLFTSASLHFQGHSHINCVTPADGPIDGRGGIAFIELTSILRGAESPDMANEFLRYILEPNVMSSIAMNPNVCNPIVQISDLNVFNTLTSQYLEAIQYETLEQDMRRCVMYDIPPNFNELMSRLQLVVANAMVGEP